MVTTLLSHSITLLILFFYNKTVMSVKLIFMTLVTFALSPALPPVSWDGGKHVHPHRVILSAGPVLFCSCNMLLFLLERVY